MAHKCNTQDSNWLSRINGVLESEIEINPEATNGTFRGRHNTSTADLFGRCFEEGGGKPDRIWFVVPNNNHLYMGHFTSNKRIKGKRFFINVDDLTIDIDLEIIRTRKDAPTTDEEDWVAVKT